MLPVKFSFAGSALRSLLWTLERAESRLRVLTTGNSDLLLTAGAWGQAFTNNFCLSYLPYLYVVCYRLYLEPVVYRGKRGSKRFAGPVPRALVRSITETVGPDRWDRGKVGSGFLFSVFCEGSLCGTYPRYLISSPPKPSSESSCLGNTQCPLHADGLVSLCAMP
jgi:hypothetical protein